MLQTIVERYPDHTFCVAVGLSEAIIGIEENEMRLIYSVKRCIEILQEENCWTYLEALEWMTYNVVDSYPGENPPIWCFDL